MLPGGGHSDHTEHLCNGVGQCGQLVIHALDFDFDGAKTSTPREAAR